jgi:hypothetical protein
MKVFSWCTVASFLIAGMIPAAAVAAPVSDIVAYGNLGVSGTDGISATNTDFGGGALSDSVLKLAQGFTTGSGSGSGLVGSLRVMNVTLGLFSNDLPASRTVSIYANNAGNPASSPLFTSDAQDVSTAGKYTFTFNGGGGALLSATTSYWIVPEGPASWYYSDDLADPPNPQATEQNSSGWQYLGTKRVLTSNTSTWQSVPLQPYSISIAVPEPSTCASLLVGLGFGGYSLVRRRKPV